MGEVKGVAGAGAPGASRASGRARKRRELGLAALVALVLALWPVWRGLFDPARVLLAVDTATVQSPWAEALGRGLPGGPPAEARDPELSDQGVVFYPAYRWVAGRLARGELPRWNPWVHAGAPGVGNPQLGVLDPQVWLLAALERLGGRALFDRGLGLLAWLRLAAAGLGAYLLARRLGLGRRGAALAGLGFAGSGFSVLWLGHSLGHVTPALPWLFYFLEGVRAGGGRALRSGAAAALTLLVAILGGHPETACFVGLAGGLRALAWGRGERRAAALALGGLALGTAGAAASLLPFVEYLRRSGATVARAALVRPELDLVGLGALLVATGALLAWRRAPRFPTTGGSVAGGARTWGPAPVAVAAALLAAALVARLPFTALVHDTFGRPGLGAGYLGADGYLERHSAWVALPVLALALAAALDPWALRRAPRMSAGAPALAASSPGSDSGAAVEAGAGLRPGFWVALGLVSWLVALDVPAVVAAFRWLPGLGLAAPARAGVLAALSLSLLAGQGLERAPRPSRVLGALLVVAAALLAVRAPAVGVPAGPEAAAALALPADPEDELAALAVSSAGPGGADPEAVRAVARVHAAVGAERAVLVCERWIGGQRFARAGPGELASERATGAPEKPLLLRGEVDPHALEAGIWRLALEVEGPGGQRLGRRVAAPFEVRHRPRLTRATLAVLLATGLGCLLPPGPGGLLLVAAALAQVALFSRGIHPAVPRAECFPPTGTTDFLARELGNRRYLADRGVLPANTGMVYGLAALDGYDGLDVAAFNELRLAALAPGAQPLLDWTPRGVDLDSAAFRLFGVGALVCARPLEHPDWRLAAAPLDEVGAAEAAGLAPAETWIYLPRDPLPRAFCVRSTRSLESVRADPAGFDPRREAFLRGALWSPRDPFTRARVDALAWGQEQIELEVELDGDGLLVVTEQHFPGWIAKVDGQRRPLLAADGIFRGVPLAAGDRRVTLTYRPLSFLAGLWVSGLALAAVGALALASRGQRPTDAG